MSKRNRTAVVVLAATLGWAGSAAAQEHEHSHENSGDAAAVAETLEAVFAATEAADFDALDRLYAGDDLTIVEGAGIDRGWSGYRDHHLAPELEQFEEFSYTPRNIEAFVEGDLAWAHFEYDLLIAAGDREIDRVGRGTAVFERRDGHWVVRHMQTANRARS